MSSNSSPDGQRAAKEFAKTLRLRRCTCGGTMRPIQAGVRADAILGVRLSGWRGDSATFRCDGCGKSRVIAQAELLTIPLLLGLVSLLPLLRPSQFSTLGLCLYLLLLPGTSLCIYLVLLKNGRLHPELGQPPTGKSSPPGARFAVGPDGAVKDEDSAQQKD
jgi:hypothetical protein